MHLNRALRLEALGMQVRARANELALGLDREHLELRGRALAAKGRRELTQGRQHTGNSDVHEFTRRRVAAAGREGTPGHRHALAGGPQVRAGRALAEERGQSFLAELLGMREQLAQRGELRARALVEELRVPAVDATVAARVLVVELGTAQLATRRRKFTERRLRGFLRKLRGRRGRRERHRGL